VVVADHTIFFVFAVECLDVRQFHLRRRVPLRRRSRRSVPQMPLDRTLVSTGNDVNVRDP
jgi:hypothetical protein